MPPEKLKSHPSENFDQKKFLTYYSLFKAESNTTTELNVQQHLINAEIKAEIKGFFATENLTAETEEGKVLNCRNLNKTKYPHLASFARKYFSAPSSSMYFAELFPEAGNFYKQKRNRLLLKTGEKSPPQLKKKVFFL